MTINDRPTATVNEEAISDNVIIDNGITDNAIIENNAEAIVNEGGNVQEAGPFSKFFPQ